MPVITLEGCSLKHEAWRQKKKKKITDIYNLEDEGREASKLISSIFRSETELCLSAWAWSAFVCYFPAVIRVTTFGILMDEGCVLTGFITLVLTVL